MMENNLSLDLTRVPKELKLLLEIIKDENNLNLKKFMNEGEDIDWELFKELAIHHRLFPLLVGKLRKMEGQYIPRDLFQDLDQLYKHNTFRMLHLTREMEMICKSFNDNQIKSLVLKGPILAADLYGDLSLRTSADLDILVPITELDKAKQLLIDLGFERDGEIQPVFSDWKWRSNHHTYFHTQKGVKCEVHWRLYPLPGKEPSFDELWERRRVSSLTNYPIHYLGREDLLLYLASHGARHGWSRLRWLVDIEKLLKQEINWTFFYEQLNKYKKQHIVGQAILLSSQLLKTIIPQEMEILVSSKIAQSLAQRALFYCEHMVNLSENTLPSMETKYFNRYLFSTMPNYQKILFTITSLYPSKSDVETLPLPKKLYFLYFPLRPFLSIWRKKRKQVLL